MSSDDDYLTTSNNTECDRAERPVGTYKDNIQLFPEHKMARDYRRLYDWRLLEFSLLRLMKIAKDSEVSF